MTKLNLRPYQGGDDPPPGSVPVSVVVLTLNEEPNIRRCLASVGWADQVVVVDSGSTDGTVAAAKSMGAEVVEQPWLGFSAQRDYALRMPLIRHDWVYFVDADEWVSPQLAVEIAAKLADPQCAGFAHRLRLVFMGTWIRHCGWYTGSWRLRLTDRRHTRYDGSPVGERPCVTGRIRRLRQRHRGRGPQGPVNLAAQARAVCGTRGRAASQRLPPDRATGAAAARGPAASAPLARSILKELVFPRRPGQARRALPLHVHRPARLPRRHGRAPLLPVSRLVRVERVVAPGRGPPPGESGG